VEKSKLTNTEKGRRVKCMLIIFFYIRGIVINYSSWQAKQSILHTTVMFYGKRMKILPQTLATRQLAVASL
jgi:hypothetical protein